MKKYLIFLLLIGLKLTVSAQTISDFHTELEKVDTSHVTLDYQRESIILGKNYPTIIITDVVYHKHAKKYFVYGFIDNVNYARLEHFKNIEFEIFIFKINNEKCIYKTKTGKNGLFAFSLSENEKARFNSELYVDLYIKRPE